MAGRPRKIQQNNIVDPSEIMDNEAIQLENWTLEYLNLEFQTKESAIRWLVRRRLLSNSIICPTCKVSFYFTLSKITIDGCRWVCPECNCRKSIRLNSIFAKSHMTLKQITIIIYSFAMGLRRSYAKHEARITQGNTLTVWYKLLKEKIAKNMKRSLVPKKRLGIKFSDVICAIAEQYVV